jgi:hypothetical protein
VAGVRVLRLYNSVGRLVDEIEIGAFPEGWNLLRIDFPGKYPWLPQGMYTVIVVTGERTSEPVRMLYMK